MPPQAPPPSLGWFEVCPLPRFDLAPLAAAVEATAAAFGAELARFGAVLFTPPGPRADLGDPCGDGPSP